MIISGTPKTIAALLLPGALLLTQQPAWSKSPAVKKNPASVMPAAPKTTRAEMAGQTDLLRALMLSLYTQHPQELAKSTQVGPREMTEWVFDGKANWKFDAIRSLQKTEAIALVFNPEYTGDTVLPLIVGLETLLFDAYDAKNEFDIPPERNVERLQRVSCQMQALRTRVNHPEAAARERALFEHTASKNLILQTLQQMIQQLHASIATVSASPETDC